MKVTNKKFKGIILLIVGLVALNWDDNKQPSSQVMLAEISAKHARKIHDCIKAVIVKKQ